MTDTAGRPVVNFEALFHQAPCGYLVTDDGGRIAAVNDTFVRWTGYSRTTLLGTKLQSLMPVGDQILYATHCIPQLGITGSVSEIAVDIVGADHIRRPALLSASRFAAAGQESGSIRVIIFSAHERRLYETELVSALRAAEESDAKRALAEQELRRLALHDALTGLPNRAGLKARFGAAPHGGARERKSLAALFIDLDHFKAVNDSLGHSAGDNLLVSVAGRLAAAVQASGAVARLSGDEFVVVDEVAGTDDATALAASLLDVMAAPMHLEGLEIVISASIGIAVAQGGDDTVEDLIRRADIAVYRAKERGRNRWELHRPAPSDPAVDRLRALGELRRGIGAGALRVHYQPRIDLRTGRASGVEALVRWQHPTRGLLPPSEFIAMAEESGLVRPLGAWVLDETLKLAESLRRNDHGAGLEFAVNLSARQLNDPGLVDMVEGALERRSMDPALLLLEITETALMSDPGAAVESLNALKNLGVGLAVDDFGTGYSSLTYLKKFPVNELKIDRSFIMGLGLDTGDGAIVGSCIDLAHAVGIRAVAEGVETSGQAQALQDMGCDLAQGYLFARPLPVPQLREWLASHA
ncbi:diguanylate cyclase (GGDEF)-like protein/PAS domain S-box-containing protein [Arthrobacter sp. SORGH_AS 212]|uniref:EAL domain-containing protein n=1 Tax=Pseudarthrobacter sp. SORGH_AS 212 TaxID=3041777 RepID=UPI002784A737|nr:diguanylate cyclase (GGDEF)-like protein/PAS domain S-box-containing protein [Arthrobacter sp. SORGH_AS_0212]